MFLKNSCFTIPIENFINYFQGLLSTQEALFHMVPLVGVPLANDQTPNLIRAEANGFAIKLDLLTMTKDDLKLAIQTAMNDEDMQKSIEKMHDLFTGNHFFIVNIFVNYKLK